MNTSSVITDLKPWRLGFLGPQGSHSHQAAVGLLGLLAIDQPVALTPVATLTHLMARLEARELDAAILPYENALEGSVVEVLETLGTGRRRLFVQAEFLQPVAHCLIQRQPGSAVHTILSHPMGAAQCKETLARLYGQTLKIRHTSSTSEAVQLLAEMSDSSGVAAIANATAAHLFHLPVVYPDISDAKDNLTRFFMVTADPHWPEAVAPVPDLPTDKCSLCFALPEYPGSLMKYLRWFYRFQVNLTKLESRPTRLRYGDYRFFVDCDVDVTQVAHGALLRELQAKASFFHLQGPYRDLGRSLALSIPTDCRSDHSTDLMDPLTVRLSHCP